MGVLDLFKTKQRAKYIKLPGVGKLPRSKYSDQTALTLSGVFAAVGLLAGHLSSIPLNVYRRTENGGRVKDTGTPLWTALHDEPYPGMSSVEFREALVANIEYYGVGYVAITYSGNRYNFMPFNTRNVTPDKQNNQFRIFDESSGKEFTVPGSNMIVFPALSFDGSNPIHMQYKRKRSLSLAISYEERAESFNTNGAMPSGVVTWGEGYNKLQEAERKRLEKHWEQLYQGVKNAGGTGFLPNGSDFKPVEFNPEVLQMLESRKFSIQEIARWFRIPPHKIGELSNATFSNIEHQAIEYVQDSILPRATKIESILTIALIPEEKRDKYFIEFNLDGLLRGDTKSRYEAYSVGKQWGWLSSNDIRKLENMNPLPDQDGGNMYMVPLNMIPANLTMQEPRQKDSAPERNIRESEATERSREKQQHMKCRAAATVRRRITDAYRPAFERTQKSLTKKEVDKVRTEAKENLPQNLPGFLNFLDEFYSDDVFTTDIRNEIRGIITDYANQISISALEEIGAELDSNALDNTIATYIDNYAYRHSKLSKNQLKKIAREANADDTRDSLQEVNTRLDEWEEKRPEKFKNDETISAEGAFSKASWALAGVTKLMWVTHGENCPYCNAMNGKIIGISSNFVTKGESLHPEGAQYNLSPGTNIGHPPLHEGCDCGISAVIGD